MDAEGMKKAWIKKVLIKIANTKAITIRAGDSRQTDDRLRALVWEPGGDGVSLLEEAA
jgi:hypothetical protein